MSGRSGEGYGNPPASGRFEKGRSGNPKGRPPGSHREPPHEAVLGQMVQVSRNGVAETKPAYEAFQLRLLDLAMKGNNAAARAIEILEEELDGNIEEDELLGTRFVVHFVTPGNITMALEPLKMARIIDRNRPENARLLLEPWIVEEALNRPGAPRLSRTEQQTVLGSTRTPKKVKWPEWWEVLPE